MPTQPQRDSNGKVIPYDDPAIMNDHWLIRRISEQQVVVDPKTGGRRISTLAFNHSSEPNGGMSIDLQHEIEQAGLNAKEYVTTPRWIGSVRFQACRVRQMCFQVGADPIEARGGVEANPYHGEVWGTFSPARKNALRQMSEWFVPIDGVSI